MDKLAKVRAEIEKLHGNPYYMMAVKDVLEIFDMQEEPESEELEIAANAYISNENNYSHSRTDTFKAGAEWQARQGYKECLVDLKPDFAKSIIAAKKLKENPELRNLTEEEINELENGSTKLSNMSKAEDFITAHTRDYINTAQEWDNGNSTLVLYPWITPDDARKAVKIAREEMIEWIKDNIEQYPVDNWDRFVNGLITD